MCFDTSKVLGTVIGGASPLLFFLLVVLVLRMYRIWQEHEQEQEWKCLRKRDRIRVLYSVGFD